MLHPHIKALSLLYVNLLDVLLVPEVSHRVQVLTCRQLLGPLILHLEKLVLHFFQ